VAHKRIIDIATHQVELAPLIPVVGAVHDRVVIEARRGCDRMCRFCQPCFINLPVREQSIDVIKESALKEIEKTGYEECSLLSLSIADYSELKPLITEVAGALKEKNVSLSLPSQRADRFNLEVAEAVQSVKKSTLTFAPEAGTARMRDVINKNLSDAEIMNAVTTAFRAGWNKVKLYFMIGLPTETQEDLDGIFEMVLRMRSLCEEIKREPGLSLKSHLEVNITLSNFVPKPHTPFQWVPQDSIETLHQKIKYLRSLFRPIRGVKINYTDPELSKLEAVISKGGEELADVIVSAYEKGAYLDAWDDVQNFQKWYVALKENNLDYEAYTRERLVSPEDVLPWDPIDVGLEKSWLKKEFEIAKLATGTVPCFEACSTCGVCANFSTWPKFMDPNARKKVLKKVDAKDTDISARLKKPSVGVVRLKIQKRGQLRFMSHLDWLRMIHRAISRSKLPVAFSQGFSPSLKTSFGPALPLLTASEGEYLDIELTEHVPEVSSILNKFLPDGGKILEEQQLPLHSPVIEESILSLSYTARWTCKEPEKEYTIINRVKFLLEQPTLMVDVETKKSRKSLDLAPYLSDLRVEKNTVSFTLKRRTEETGQPVHIKPDWVLSLIDGSVPWSITRTQLVLKNALTQAQNAPA
jgi:radical SAM-linked protein